jgi:hypothetical protein
VSRIQIITPPVAESAMDTDLVHLTEYIWRKHHVGESYGYGLGGEFGYGVEFENDVFAMFPFYWGECECGWDQLEEGLEELAHDQPCYQTELTARFEADGLGYDRETWQPRNPDLSYEERRQREDAIYGELTAEYALPRAGCAVHCTCTRRARWKAQFDAVKLGPNGHAETCPTMRPNFLHKNSGLRIDWYKWIGRDTKPSRDVAPAEWRAIFDECVASIAATPTQGGTPE